MLAAVTAVQLLAVAAAWLLRARERLLRERLPYLVSLAVGVLLATAILHLLPEAIATLGNQMRVWLLFGGTMLALFAVERIFYAVTGVTVEQPSPQALLREHDATAHGHGHQHGSECRAGEVAHDGRGARPLNLLMASMLHSFVDGATIATGFAAGPRIGWLTAFAVALHEVPHRIGDFALLVHLQVPIRRALQFAVLAGVPALLGVMAVLLFGGRQADAIHWLLPVSAGSFLYIATVNLLPELQVECRGRRVALQLACLVGGVLLVLGIAGVPQG